MQGQDCESASQKKIPLPCIQEMGLFGRKARRATFGEQWPQDHDHSREALLIVILQGDALPRSGSLNPILEIATKRSLTKAINLSFLFSSFYFSLLRTGSPHRKPSKYGHLASNRGTTAKGNTCDSQMRPLRRLNDVGATTTRGRYDNSIRFHYDNSMRFSTESVGTTSKLDTTNKRVTTGIAGKARR
jgi:hypothetical protein